MPLKAALLVLLVVAVLVTTSASADAAAAAAGTRPTRSNTTHSKHTSNASSAVEAGQFFGLSIHFGEAAQEQANTGTTQQLTGGFSPGSLLGSLASAVFGVQVQQPAAAQKAQQLAAPTKKPAKPPQTTKKHQLRGPSSLIRQEGPPPPSRKFRQPVVASAPSFQHLPPATPPGTVPMCEWRSDYGACHVHRHYYLALTNLQQPGNSSSYIAQTITAASARDYACHTAYNKEPLACQEAPQALRCGWNLSAGRKAWETSGCRSYFMAEWTVFAFLVQQAGVGPAQAASGLTNLGAFSCAGSLADRALACNTAYPMDRFGVYDASLCAAAAPGCTFQASTNNCVVSPQLTAQLAELDPADVGTCSASCYLRSLRTCPAAAAAAAAAAKQPTKSQALKKKKLLVAEAGARCDLYGSQLARGGAASASAWGSKVAAADAACSREHEAWGCAQAGAKGLVKLPLALLAASQLSARGHLVAAALQHKLPGPGTDDAKCAV